MGCILSYFSGETGKPNEGQLTDKLLQESADHRDEEGNAAEPDERTAPRASPERDSITSEQRVQDDATASDEQMLLGALGATAAGAVTVGAVAGALKAAEHRDGGLRRDEAAAAAAASGEPGAHSDRPETDGGSVAADDSRPTAGHAITSTGGDLRAASDHGEAAVSGEDQRDEPRPSPDGGDKAESSELPTPDRTGESTHDAMRAELKEHRSGYSSSARAVQSPDSHGSLHSPGGNGQIALPTNDARTSSPTAPDTDVAAPSGENKEAGHHGVESRAENYRTDGSPATDAGEVESPAQESRMEGSRTDVRWDDKSRAVASPSASGDIELAHVEEDSPVQTSAQIEKSYRPQSQSAVTDTPPSGSAEKGGMEVQQDDASPRPESISAEELPGSESGKAAKGYRDKSAIDETYTAQYSTADEESELRATVSDILSKSPVGTEDSPAQSAAENIWEPSLSHSDALLASSEKGSYIESTKDKESMAHSADAKHESHDQSPMRSARYGTESDDLRASSSSASVEPDKIAGGQSDTFADSGNGISGSAEGDSQVQDASVPDSRSEHIEPAEHALEESRTEILLDHPEAGDGRETQDESPEIASGRQKQSPISDVNERNENKVQPDIITELKGTESSEAAVPDTNMAASVQGDVPTTPHTLDSPIPVDTPHIVPEQREANQTSPDWQRLVEGGTWSEAGQVRSVSQFDNLPLDYDDMDAGNAQPPPTDSRLQHGAADVLQAGQSELSSRARSSVGAVAGSITELQEGSPLQSPVASVHEDTIAKVDRYSTVSKQSTASIDNIQSNEVSAKQMEGTSSLLNNAGETGSLGTLEAGDRGLEDADPQVVSSQAPRDIDSPTADKMDAALDVSDRTEDIEYDPLAQTQSIIFPDDLVAGRTSVLSEKPSSPFPDLQGGVKNTATTSVQPEGSTDSTPEEAASPRSDETANSRSEEAATKIQAGVRGWQVRRKISQQNSAATQIQAGFRGWKVRREQRMRRTSSLPNMSQEVTEHGASGFMNVDDLKTRAASKIQAGFRGWKTRQGLKSVATESQNDRDYISPATYMAQADAEISPAISMSNMSSEDKAAVKIQAGYRGWKARRTLRRSMSDPNSEALVLASGLDRRSVEERGSQPDNAPTPRDEDETAHSIQSIQSEVASTPRQDQTLVDSLRSPDPSAALPAGAATDPPAPSPTPSPSHPAHADDAVAPLDHAAATIQAGYRGWKTRQTMRNADGLPRPGDSAKSVTDSGALPIDFAIVHRPEDDWLTQDLQKLDQEKRTDATDGQTVEEDASTDSASSWLTRAQTEIKASFQGLRENVNDALKTVEDTARMVRENAATAGSENAPVEVRDKANTVADKGGSLPISATAPTLGADNVATSETETKAEVHAYSKETLEVPGGKDGAKSPAEREEEEIWEEIQRNMHYED